MARRGTYDADVVVYGSPEELGGAIRRARRQAEMSQQDLADAAGVSIGTVKRWERGDEPALGRTVAARRSTAVVVADVTRAPRSAFNLPELGEAVEGLEYLVSMATGSLSDVRTRLVRVEEVLGLSESDEQSEAGILERLASLERALPQLREGLRAELRAEFAQADAAPTDTKRPRAPGGSEAEANGG